SSRAFLLGKGFAHNAHLLRKLRSCLRARTKEAVAVHDCPAQRIRMTATKPDWRMGFLERLRFHGGAFELPEPAFERDPWLGPKCFHQQQPFRKSGNEALGIDSKCREHPGAAARTHTRFQAAATKLIKRRDALRQVKRTVQRHDENDASDSKPLCAGRSIRHGFDRAQMRHCANHLFSGPGTFEAECFCTRYIDTKSARAECAIREMLWNRDRKSHSSSVALSGGNMPHAIYDIQPDACIQRR